MGGSGILSPLEFGVNSRFYSVLNDGGIRNSESLRIWCKIAGFVQFKPGDIIESITTDPLLYCLNKNSSIKICTHQVMTGM